MSRTRTWTKPAVAALAGLALAATPLVAASAGTPSGQALAPLVVGDASAVIPGKYLVVLNDGATLDMINAVASTATTAGGTVSYTYDTVLKGFAAVMSDAAVSAVRGAANVRYVAPDQTVELQDVQEPATWGIDRVDRRRLPLNEKYRWQNTGAGVTTYVIDSGINATHNDFTGRVGEGVDFIGDGQGTNDCLGHGTHVSGTLGGTTWGVAKEVTIVPVRVFGCSSSGDWADLIAGMEWVAENHAEVSNATLSAGGGVYQPADEAAAALVEEGIPFTVSAGNSSTDACTQTPAHVPSVITVGSTTSTDARSDFSNWGTCLDIFAPGSNITSAWIGGDDAQNTISGTSMSTPHVAGWVALQLERKPDATPAEIASFLIKKSSKDKITDPGTGSPNRLLFTAPGRQLLLVPSSDGVTH